MKMVNAMTTLKFCGKVVVGEKKYGNKLT